MTRKPDCCSQALNSFTLPELAGEVLGTFEGNPD